jgi:hypothetical protein
MAQPTYGIGDLLIAIFDELVRPKGSLDLVAGDKSSSVADQEVKQFKHLPVNSNGNSISDQTPIFGVVDEPCKSKDGWLVQIHTPIVSESASLVQWKG